MTVATRSISECAASESTASDPVAIPTTPLAMVSPPGRQNRGEGDALLDVLLLLHRFWHGGLDAGAVAAGSGRQCVSVFGMKTMGVTVNKNALFLASRRTRSAALAGKSQGPRW